jgi:hypothetical protein
LVIRENRKREARLKIAAALKYPNKRLCEGGATIWKGVAKKSAAAVLKKFGSVCEPT